MIAIFAENPPTRFTESIQGANIVQPAINESSNCEHVRCVEKKRSFHAKKSPRYAQPVRTRNLAFGATRLNTNLEKSPPQDQFAIPVRYISENHKSAITAEQCRKDFLESQDSEERSDYVRNALHGTIGLVLVVINTDY